jgi:hypothetical protein
MATRLAVVPLAEAVQLIGKIFERSALRQHERKCTVLECLSRGVAVARSFFLAAILSVRRHWLSVSACKRAIVIPDIADAPIDVRQRCRLFPSVGDTADGCQSTVSHSHVGAACAI